MIEFFILIGLSIFLIIKAVDKSIQDKQAQAANEAYHRQYQQKERWFRSITHKYRYAVCVRAGIIQQV